MYSWLGWPVTGLYPLPPHPFGLKFRELYFFNTELICPLSFSSRQVWTVTSQWGNIRVFRQVSFAPLTHVYVPLWQFFRGIIYAFVTKSTILNPSPQKQILNNFQCVRCRQSRSRSLINVQWSIVTVPNGLQDSDSGTQRQLQSQWLCRFVPHTMAAKNMFAQTVHRTVWTHLCQARSFLKRRKVAK